jgi:hypothetical protein
MKALVICGFVALAGVISWQHTQMSAMTSRIREAGDAVGELRLAIHHDGERLEDIEKSVTDHTEWRYETQPIVEDLVATQGRIPKSFRGIEDEFVRVNGDLEALRNLIPESPRPSQALFEGMEKERQEQRIQDLERARLQEEMKKAEAERAASLRRIMGR